MKKHLKKFFLAYDYPEDSVKQLLEAWEKLENSAEFISLVERFYTDNCPIPKEIETVMDAVSEAVGVHPYTAKFLYYCALTRDLPEEYNKRGISHVVMHDSLNDLRYKLMECLEVHGLPGFFSTSWFYGFFKLQLFKLGRLEFHVVPYKGEDRTVGDQLLKNGDDIINIHIPSSGEPFDEAARYDSYEKAYHFFKEKFSKDVKVFHCHSWLLYKEQEKFLPEKSNIRGFMKDFNIVSSEEYETPRDNMWRIFGKYADLPANELPRDTSLRRAYAEWFEAGNTCGFGRGYFMWDDVLKRPVK